jgi:electron transport complex protein RnfD
MARELPLLGPVPLLRRPARAGSLMWRVVAALSPALGLGVFAYGLPALWMATACMAGAWLTEALALSLRGHGSLKDGSAILSGLLLALTLPPGLAPGWAFLGGALAILLGKQAFGGLGRNPVNPALLGRLALSLMAPAALEQGLRLPFAWKTGTWMQTQSAAVADPLRVLWETRRVLDQALAGLQPVLPEGWPAGLERLDLIQHAQDLLSQAGPSQVLWAQQAGLLGEVSILALLPGLVWLFTARLVDWRVPAAGLLFLPIGFLLASGGAGGHWLPLALGLRGTSLLLLLCVLASDPVTSPLGQSAKFLYGLLVAAAALLALQFSPQAGGLFWVLLPANLLTPWLDRLLLPGGPR